MNCGTKTLNEPTVERQSPCRWRHRRVTPQPNSSVAPLKVSFARSVFAAQNGRGLPFYCPSKKYRSRGVYSLPKTAEGCRSTVRLKSFARAERIRCPNCRGLPFYCPSKKHRSRGAYSLLETAEDCRSTVRLKSFARAEYIRCPNGRGLPFYCQSKKHRSRGAYSLPETAGDCFSTFSHQP